LIRDVEVLDIREKRKNGMSIADIARSTGYSELTVRKWLREDGQPRYRRRKRRPSILDPYKEYIMQRMADGVFNCEVLLRELKERGYPGSITILKDYVAPFRRQFQVHAVRRFETDPGEQMQVDWGFLGSFLLDGLTRKVWVFTGTLCYSRLLTAHCITSVDLESLLLSHQYCFQAAGGVTRQIVYDNMKTVTLGRDDRFRPVWQSRFLDFALYYGFQPIAHQPYRPRSKGKVERMIGYIKQNFCPGRTFTDLTDLNAQLQSWLDTVANVRVHDTTGEQPIKRWAEESLQPLPARPFPVQVRFSRRVSRDSYVSYLGVLYSVPWPHAGSSVEVEETVTGRLRFWWHGQVVAEHTMPRDGRRRVTDPHHSAGLPEAQRRNQASGLRQCYPEVQRRPLTVYEAFAGGSGQ